MSDADAYAKAGVDQGAADSAVAGLVRALGAIELGRPSRQVPLPGHYASVIRLDERTGIALSTDGVGTKLLVAEQLGRFDTVGIDCVAMNVNDVICVGAEPLAMLDYIAIERADPEVCEQIGVGLARGAELAGIEIPGGELAQLGDMVRGFDVAGACFGTVALDAIVDGSAVQPGDPVIGLPSSGIHSNGYTLARSALDGLAARRGPRRAARAARSATCCSSRPRSTSSRCWSCCAPRSRCAASPTSPPAGSATCSASPPTVGYEIDDPLPVPPIFELIQERAGVPDDGDAATSSTWAAASAASSRPSDEEAALELLRATTRRRSGSAGGSRAARDRRPERDRVR